MPSFRSLPDTFRQLTGFNLVGHHLAHFQVSITTCGNLFEGIKRRRGRNSERCLTTHDTSPSSAHSVLSGEASNESSASNDGRESRSVACRYFFSNWDAAPNMTVIWWYQPGAAFVISRWYGISNGPCLSWGYSYTANREKLFHGQI